MRLLLVEDDAMIGEAVQDLLRAEHHAVDWVRDGPQADAALAAQAYDLVLLDLGLPGRDGLQVLRDLRARRDRTPVLITTARDAVAQRVQGLDAGADDYLLKPFDLRELAARLQTLLRRVAGRSVNLIEHGCLTYDPSSRETFLSGQPVDLSRREQALLQALLHNKGRVLSSEQLKDSVYGFNDELESNALNVHIHHLRRKLGNGIVETVRGLGYRLGPAGTAKDAS